jgi:hypothetical protein
MHLARWKNPFAYFFLKLINPRSEIFLDSGFGIEARFGRCEHHWRSHLNATCEFINEAFINYSQSQTKPEMVTVVGAGRCFDLDVSFLLETADVVELIDADPSARRYFKKYIAPRLGSRMRGANYSVVDVTGTFIKWELDLVELIRAVHRNLDNALSAIATSSWEINASIAIPFSHTVVSLNILSQLGVLWNAVVEKYVARFLRLSPDKIAPSLRADIWKATFNARNCLERAHLKALAEQARHHIVLITDVEWTYFDQRQSVSESEPALTLDDLVSPAPFAETARKSWVWNIIPQGIEEMEYGSTHSVVAVTWKR